MRPQLGCRCAGLLVLLFALEGAAVAQNSPAPLPPPNLSFIYDPPDLSSGLNVPLILGLKLDLPLPYPVNGVVNLSFTPPPDGNSLDNPAVVFSNGGRTLFFTIPPGVVSIPLGFVQIGDVAGVVTLSISQVIVAGQAVPTSVLLKFQIPALPPILTSGPCGSTGPTSQPSVTVTGSTNTRDLTDAFLTVIGSRGTVEQFTLDLRDISRVFFGDPSRSFGGGLFKLTLPIVLSDPSEALQSVSTMVGNSVGRSTTLPGGCGTAVQPGLTFKAVAGARAPASQSVDLFSKAQQMGKTIAGNGGQPAFNFTATASTTSGGSWLSVSPTTGMLGPDGAQGPLEVSVDLTGLSAGDYYGLVQVVAPGAPDSPQFVTVALNLLSDTAQVIPEVSPLGLIFSNAAESVQTISLTNIGSRPAPFTISRSFPDGAAFGITPLSGTVLPGQTTVVQVQPPGTGLAPGEYNGTLHFGFPDGSADVNLLLVVPTGPSAALTAHADRQTATDAEGTAPCIPGKLLPRVTLLGSNSSIAVGWPTPIQAIVLDSCGVLATGDAVTASFSNGDEPVPLALQPNGRWQGTWTPSSRRGNEVAVSILARRADIQGVTTVSAAANANEDPQVPVLSSAGILNEASQVPAAPAPGELVAIRGLRLTNGNDANGVAPLPLQLGVTQLNISGRRLPLSSISGPVVNAVMPYDLPQGATLKLIAIVGNRISTPVSVSTGAADPAIYSADLTGAGQGQIYVISSSGELVLATPAQPAHAGDMLLIRCAGLGQVSPPIDAGLITPVDLSGAATNTVTVTIGGIPVTASSAQLSPGLIGVYEVRARVPDDVSPGDQVMVSVSVAGRTSPAVAMSVQ